MSTNTDIIRNKMIELRNIKLEMDRLKLTLKDLTSKSNQIQETIHKYLIDNNQKSITYLDLKIEATVKKKRERKTKGIKEKDAVQVLQSAGIRDAKRLYYQMVESMKGEVVEQSTVKVEKNDNRK
jgi:hypothetical protein